MDCEWHYYVNVIFGARVSSCKVNICCGLLVPKLLSSSQYEPSETFKIFIFLSGLSFCSINYICLSSAMKGVVLTLSMSFSLCSLYDIMYAR